MKWLRCRYLLGTLALLLVALVAGLYVFSEPLLNDLLRPRLAILAAERLSAEVSIGRLNWQKGVLQVDTLHVQRPDYYRVEVPQVRLELGLKDLLQGRLSALEIESPTLFLQAPTSSPPSGNGFPAHPPFNIGRLMLRNGRIDYRLAERLLSLRQVKIDLRKEGIYNFRLQGVLGEDDGISLQLAGGADWQQGLHLDLHDFSWDGRPLLAEDLSLSVPPEGFVGGNGRIHLTRFDRASYERLRSGLQLPSILPADWDFSLRDAELSFRLNEQEGPQFSLRLAAALIQKDRLTLPFGKLDFKLGAAKAGWQGQGTFLLAGDNPGKLSANWSAGVLQGQLSLPVAEPGRLKTQLLGGPALGIAGGFNMEADFSAQEKDVRVQVELKGRSGVRQNKKYLMDLAPLRLRADIRSAGKEFMGQARLQIKDRELLIAEGGLGRLELQILPANWSHWRPLLGPRLRPEALQGLNGFSGKGVLKRRMSGEWVMSASLGSRRMVWAGLSLDSGSSRLHLNGGPGGLVTGQISFKGRRLAGENLDIASLSGSTRLRFQKGRLSLNKVNAAAQLKGPGHISGGVVLNGSADWQAKRWQARLGALELRDLEWLSEDGLSGFAGARIAVRGQLNGRAGQPLRAVLQADLAVAEALWGQYYAELAHLPTRVEVRLDWHSVPRRLEAEQWSLRLGKIATLQGIGLISSDEIHLSGGLLLPKLAGPAADLLRSLLAESQPTLVAAKLSGGLQADFTVHNRGGWQLQGEILPRQVSLELPAADLLLEDLRGRLPFSFAFGAGSTEPDSLPRNGELRFRRLQLGPAQLAETPLHFVSQRNGFRFQVPVVLQVAEGRIAVADLLLGTDQEDLLLTGHFTIDGVDLERLTSDLGLVSMAGRLDADLGRIRYQGGLLSSAGEARIDALGGRIRIAEIGLDISDFSYPQLTAALDFEAIDLYQLTRAFSFGDMNGIVDGYVRDLRLFGTTPAKFTAVVESRLEGRRNISVKALSNLSILSQGGLSAALSRGIYRFIDFYRYRKIGIACDLNRDVFHLRGTALPNTDRYLVYGGVLPPKIDIIAPPSTISFSEMLKRLQRIERAD
ncbi:hypothetical protein A7E78_08705 [Syntrophotalea acetylenivorans]|uniref:AsmA-like C-terminal domain-containing protein n=1 Tax=Syntrophotalea acetylenivorans TaxID=1842532 RepID=A0A1L3GQG7_9BACT|nr:hypothetical protein [Syntrophotalea acetylenivorans]APG27908.1 hypothetical protein A7E78_08705 [Syntrophotalea acetylenivorans]